MRKFVFPEIFLIRNPFLHFDVFSNYSLGMLTLNCPFFSHNIIQPH